MVRLFIIALCAIAVGAFCPQGVIKLASIYGLTVPPIWAVWIVAILFGGLTILVEYLFPSDEADEFAAAWHRLTARETEFEADATLRKGQLDERESRLMSTLQGIHATSHENDAKARELADREHEVTNLEQFLTKMRDDLTRREVEIDTLLDQGRMIAEWNSLATEARAIAEERAALAGERIALQAAQTIANTREVHIDLANGAPLVAGRFERLEMPPSVRWWDHVTKRFVKADDVPGQAAGAGK